MSRSLRVFLVIVFCAGVAFAKGELKKNPKKIPDRYIVVLDTAFADRNSVENDAADLARLHGGRLDKVYKHSLLGFSVTMSEERALKLAKDKRVLYLEEDGVVTIDATQNGATWGLDRIDQRDLPLNTTYNYDATGLGVNVYVIDTGIRRTHQEFGSRAVAGFDSIGDGQNTNDCNGHGTHVAGTIGGNTYGVAKNANLVAVRVLDCSGSGTNSGVIAGVDWVTANHQKPAVANMSLGGGASTALDQALENSIAAGVTYAVAAGNSNTNACTQSPARTANALTVGATTSADARSSFSNFGTCVDVFAPGSSITSAWNTSDTATNTISGTSMASPHVAGVAALYLHSNPAALPAAVMAAIRDSATANKIANPGTGSPNLLLYSLLGAAPPPPPPPPPPPSNCSTTSQLLANAGFESGNTAWVADAGVITNSLGRLPRTGAYYAWLNGYGFANTDFVYQTITIPATACSATLSFYLRIDSAETTSFVAYDTLRVQIRSSSNVLLSSLASYSNLNKGSAYVQKTFNVLPWKGQTIRVYFLGQEDFSLQTSFLIDDTAVNVTQ